jgi:hypothetical protein
MTHRECIERTCCWTVQVGGDGEGRARKIIDRIYTRPYVVSHHALTLLGLGNQSVVRALGKHEVRTLPLRGGSLSAPWGARYIYGWTVQGGSNSASASLRCAIQRSM